jgi:guanosine-3',5'-bis(diphosphate) 3'-pyrophosphohydrolase
MEYKTEIQSVYQKTILFAAERHARKNQMLLDSNIPYVVHLSDVCMEILIASQCGGTFDLSLAVQAALLHDILEDTDTTAAELEQQFGTQVVQYVQGLTKDKRIPAEERMRDSLKRIKACPKEAWAVKLADRITNLQPPPKSWPLGKIVKYRNEAEIILAELGEANPYLVRRLKREIEKYRRYCHSADFDSP